MTPYFLLLAISLFFTIVTFQKKKQLEFQGITDRKRLLHSINWTLPVFFLMLYILLTLRGVETGSDTPSYKMHFDRWRLHSWETMLDDKTELLYRLTNWLVGRVTDNFQWFLAVTSALMLLPIAYIYNKDREHSFLKIVLFVNMPTFVMMFSGIPQALAITCGVVAYQFVKKKKLIPFLLTVLVAIGFHMSGIIILALYPLFHFPIQNKHLWLTVPAVAVVFIFNEPIFLFLANKVYGAYTGMEDVVTTTATGAYDMLIFFLILSVFCYIVPDENKMDREDFALRNILLFATAMQSFTLVHMLAMRMNYYFIIFLPLAVAKIIQKPKDEFKNVAKWAEIIMCIFFAGYFIWSIVASVRSGRNSLNTVPYVPFWN